MQCVYSLFDFHCLYRDLFNCLEKLPCRARKILSLRRRQCSHCSSHQPVIFCAITGRCKFEYLCTLVFNHNFYLSIFRHRKYSICLCRCEGYDLAVKLEGVQLGVSCKYHRPMYWIWRARAPSYNKCTSVL